MSTLAFKIPVVTPQPVGCVEWAVSSGRLYGIDRAGTVYLFGPVPRRRPSRSWWARALRAFGGRA